MALKKAAIFKGLAISNAYYKITRIEVSEKENNPKKYNAIVEVVAYTDSTKENIFWNNRYKFTVTEDQLNFSNYYALLKNGAEFSNAVDV